MKWLSVLILFICIRAAAAPPCVDCNVVLISLDTVAASHLGVYGSKANNSPNLDRWAEKSRVYLSAYSPSPWTLPAHGAMLSGYSPWNLGLLDEHDRYPAQAPTLATTLKNAGYKTFAVSAGPYIDADHGFARGFESFTRLDTWKDAKASVDLALDWIDKNKRKKFFAFIHSYHAHEPFIPSADSLRTVDPSYDGQLNEIGLKTLLKIARKPETITPDQRRRIPVLYDAGIRDQDVEIGRFLAALEKRGLDQNTIVIVTSDHGEGMGEHGLWGLHAFNVYEELIRVPLIVRVPHASARQLKSPVSLIDIAPTLHDLLRIQGDYHFDGRLLVEADAANAERAVFAETAIEASVSIPLQERDVERGDFSPDRAVTRDQQWKRIPKVERMVRSGNFKLILKFDRTFELYDLSKDPAETTNIFTRESQVAERLKTLMLQER